MVDPHIKVQLIAVLNGGSFVEIERYGIGDNILLDFDSRGVADASIALNAIQHRVFIRCLSLVAKLGKRIQCSRTADCTVNADIRTGLGTNVRIIRYIQIIRIIGDGVAGFYAVCKFLELPEAQRCLRILLGIKGLCCPTDLLAVLHKLDKCVVALLHAVVELFKVLHLVIVNIDVDLGAALGGHGERIFAVVCVVTPINRSSGTFCQGSDRCNRHAIDCVDRSTAVERLCLVNRQLGTRIGIFQQNTFYADCARQHIDSLLSLPSRIGERSILQDLKFRRHPSAARGIQTVTVDFNQLIVIRFAVVGQRRPCRP